MKRGGKITTKRGKVITFFIISVTAIILANILPENFLFGLPIIIDSLAMVVFSSLSFAFSIRQIRRKDLSFGITFLVLSAIIMLLWVIGFLIGLITVA